MRKALFVLFGLLLSAPFWGQEIVVFRDFRSLVVQGHRVQGDWTYLRVGGGELAVLSRGIQEIRQEAADGRAVSSAVPAGAAIGPVPVGPPRQAAPQASPLQTPSPMSFRPPQPNAANQKPALDADDSEDDGPEADDEGDDEEAPKPAQPPAPLKPPPMPGGVIAKPGPLAPQNIVNGK